jgi:hypothetical protein
MKKDFLVKGLKIPGAPSNRFGGRNIAGNDFPAADEGKRIRVSGVREVNYADSVPNAKFGRQSGDGPAFTFDPILKLLSPEKQASLPAL